MTKEKTQPKPAVDELYRKIQSFVGRRVGQEQDREDLVQEIFLKFKKALPKLREQERLLPWLYRVATNQIVDYYRSRRSPSLPAGSPVPENAEVEENASAREVAGWLKYFIGTLGPEDQEILQLVELEGKTQKQAAELLSLTLPGAKSRHQRAKRRLKAEMEACCRYFLDARGGITGYETKSGSSCGCR